MPQTTETIPEVEAGDKLLRGREIFSRLEGLETPLPHEGGALVRPVCLKLAKGFLHAAAAIYRRHRLHRIAHAPRTLVRAEVFAGQKEIVSTRSLWSELQFLERPRDGHRNPKRPGEAKSQQKGVGVAECKSTYET